MFVLDIPSAIMGLVVGIIAGAAFILYRYAQLIDRIWNLIDAWERQRR